MTATLAWDDDALVLTVGPWRVWVASLEVYGADGTAQAFLHGWGTETCSPPMALTPGESADRSQGSGNLGVMCRSRAEAVAVIRALLALRGVDVP